MKISFSLNKKLLRKERIGKEFCVQLVGLSQRQRKLGRKERFLGINFDIFKN